MCCGFKNLAVLLCEAQKFKDVAIALQFFDDKAVSSNIFQKFFINLKKHNFYLLIYYLVLQHVYQSRVQDVEELLDIWHGLQQSAIDSAIDGEHILAPAYGPKEDILSSGNMLIA